MSMKGNNRTMQRNNWTGNNSINGSGATAKGDKQASIIFSKKKPVKIEQRRPNSIMGNEYNNEKPASSMPNLDVADNILMPRRNFGTSKVPAATNPTSKSPLQPKQTNQQTGTKARHPSKGNSTNMVLNSDRQSKGNEGTSSSESSGIEYLLPQHPQAKEGNRRRHPATRKRVGSTGSVSSCTTATSTTSSTVTARHTNNSSKPKSVILPISRRDSKSTLNAATASFSTTSNADDEPPRKELSMESFECDGDKENQRRRGGRGEKKSSRGRAKSTESCSSLSSSASSSIFPLDDSDTGHLSFNSISQGSNADPTTTTDWFAGWDDSKFLPQENDHLGDDNATVDLLHSDEWATLDQGRGKTSNSINKLNDDGFSDFSVPSFDLTNKLLSRNNSARNKNTVNDGFSDFSVPSFDTAKLLPSSFKSNAKQALSSDAAFEFTSSGDNQDFDPFFGVSLSSSSNMSFDFESSSQDPDRNDPFASDDVWMTITTTTPFTGAFPTSSEFDAFPIRDEDVFAPEAVSALRGYLIGCDFMKAGQVSIAREAFQESIDKFAIYQLSSLQSIKGEDDGTSQTTTDEWMTRITSSCLLGIGDCYMKQGQYKDALSSYKQMLSTLSTVTTKSHQHVSNKKNHIISANILYALFQIGLLYARCRDLVPTTSKLNDTDEAIQNFQRALATADNLSQNGNDGGSRKQMQLKACLLYNLGNTHRQKSNYEKALESYQQTMNVWEDENIPTFLAVATLNAIGLTNSRMGKFDEAARAHSRAMQHLSKHVAATLEKSSQGATNNDRRYQRQRDEIGLHRGRALMIQTLHRLADTHMMEAENSAGTDSVMLSLEKAAKAYRASIKLIEVSFGRTHPFIVFSIEKMGHVLERQYLYKEALESYKEAWMTMHIHHKSHPKAGQLLQQLLYSIARMEEQMKASNNIQS